MTKRVRMMRRARTATRIATKRKLLRALSLVAMLRTLTSRLSRSSTRTKASRSSGTDLYLFCIPSALLTMICRTPQWVYLYQLIYSSLTVLLEGEQFAKDINPE